MKPVILSIITILICFNSSAQETKKKKEIFPIESYYIDSAKHWTVITTSTVHKISEKFITVVAANLKQGQDWKFASYRFGKRMYFLGQIVTLDESNQISLYFQVKDLEGVKLIFQASYTKGNDPIVKEISKSNKKEWERINELIEMK